MSIIIVHLKRSGLTVPKDQLFNLSRNSKDYFLLSNEYTHLPLNKTKAKYKVDTVEQAVIEYKNKLKNRIIEEWKLDINNRPYLTILLDLYNIYIQFNKENKNMYLGCWCKDELQPKHYDHVCHCDIIKQMFIKREKRIES